MQQREKRIHAKKQTSPPVTSLDRFFCVKLITMPNKDVLAAIDKEIARLQQARDILAGESEAPIERRRKTANKPAAETKRTAKSTGRKRVLSPEARKRIADAQKKRWAAQKAEK